MQEYIKQRLYDIDDNKSLIDDYINLIDQYLQQNLIYDGCANLTERHHIVPRSIDKTLINDPNNIVVVTSHQHIKLHQLLASIDNPSLIFAFWHTLSKRRRNCESNEYALLKEQGKIKLQKWNGRPVFNINTKETFPSVASAARKYNISAGSIRCAIRRQTKCGGFFWCYNEDKNKFDEKTLEEHLKRRIAFRNMVAAQYSKNNLSLPVVNLSTGHEYYNSREAATAYGVTVSSIHQAINKKIKSAGCFWAYKKDVDGMNYHDVLCHYQQLILDRRLQNDTKHSERMMLQGNSNSKPIINLTSGEVLSCARLLDVRLGKKNNYVLRCINRYAKIDKDYWDYYDCNKSLVEQREDYFARLKNIKDKKSAKGKRILCIDNNKIYNNAVEASKDLNIIPQKIRFACGTGYKASGLRFKFVD